MKSRIFNIAPGAKPESWLTVKNEASADAAEILIYGLIGKDWWDDSGIADHEFAQVISEIPVGRKVNLRINSQGGSVKDGLGIYAQISKRKADITCIVDGYACSTASWIALAGSKTVIPENGIMMIHNPSAMVQGDAKALRELANALDQHKAAIIAMYRGKTSKGDSEISAAMDVETWFIGAEAKDWGLADEVTSLAANVQNNFDLSIFRRVPAGVTNNAKPSAAPGSEEQPQRTVMNREEMLALLAEHGVKVENTISDADLKAKVKALLAKNKTEPVPLAPTIPVTAPLNAAPAAPSIAQSPEFIAVQNQVKALEAQNAAERTTRLRGELTAIGNEGRIPLNSVENWLPLALANEATVMAQLRAMPINLPGAEPANAAPDVISEDPHEVSKAIDKLFGKGIHNAITAREIGLKRAKIINANIAKLIGHIQNTNTVSSDIKRTVILQQMIRAFAIRVMPLSAFSTAFNAPRLEGTDKVSVPYFPLITTASTDFIAGTGYTTFVNTNSDAKAITVDKRKYLGLTWTSSELARQPFMDIGMASLLIGQQLGLDVVNDVLSLFTLATFGASVKAEPSASFDSDDVMDLKGVADGLNWPGMGRSLLLNSTYDVNLLKDNAVKNAMAFGDSGPIREGRIVNIGGFDYYPDCRFPTNSEFLQGLIAFKSAMLVGFSPIGPTEEVRNLLTQYEVVVEPSTGATFEYRRFGNATTDASAQTIEANYGRLAGEAAAAGRVTSQ